MREKRILQMSTKGHVNVALMSVHGAVEQFLFWANEPKSPTANPAQELKRRREEMSSSIHLLKTVKTGDLSEREQELVRGVCALLAEFDPMCAEVPEWLAMLAAISDVRIEFSAG
ncbi:MAG: hypothetical protein H6933_02700 [Burkholderiaceae bacterium]|nr:hypothetical protein [Burkholderiaceae bacterium]